MLNKTPNPTTAWLLDPMALTLTPLSINVNNYKEFYPPIGCSCFDVVRFAVGDVELTAYVDDEGLLKSGQAFWSLSAKPPFFAGKAVITGGCDDEGNTLPFPEGLEFELAKRLLLHVDGGKDKRGKQLVILVSVDDLPNLRRDLPEAHAWVDTDGELADKIASAGFSITALPPEGFPLRAGSSEG